MNESTEELIIEHNKLMSNKSDNDRMWTIRMEIKKRENNMDWDSGYKYIDLNPAAHIVKRNIKPKEIKMEIQSSKEAIKVLQNCTVEGNVIKLPPEQLDRKLYQEVAKSLELIGGKWKGNKVMGFVFNQDPTELLKQIANGEKRNLKKEFQFFATPEKLAREMVFLADLKNHDSILEPSAGQGAIIKEINEVCNVLPDCYELMEVNRSILQKSDLQFRLIGEDFLNHSVGFYTKIIANPPFSKNQDIVHIRKMYDVCAKGGRIVTIASKHWQISSNKVETEFRNWLESIVAEITDIPAGEFKESGTNISACLITIDK